MSSSIRQRPLKASNEDSSPSPAARIEAEDSTSIFSILEIGRILTLLLVLSCAISYLITKEDIFFSYRPAIITSSYWKSLLTRPLNLTPSQLEKYNGSNPSLPLYLAINHTIYDVSAGRNFYGPGGSYASFSGADATRAFITGCFADDITPDLRGVEVMYLPIDDAEIDGQYTSGELKILREQERRIARREVQKNLEHWVGFFEQSAKYNRVGRVVGWEIGEEPWPLCEKAEKARVKRKGKGERQEVMDGA